jgi:hypothetical protein
VSTEPREDPAGFALLSHRGLSRTLDARLMARYAAKFLFDWYPDPITGGRVTLSEERIVVFPVRSPRASVEPRRLGGEGL